MDLRCMEGWLFRKYIACLTLVIYSINEIVRHFLKEWEKMCWRMLI